MVQRLREGLNGEIGDSWGNGRIGGRVSVSGRQRTKVKARRFQLTEVRWCGSVGQGSRTRKNGDRCDCVPPLCFTAVCCSREAVEGVNGLTGVTGNS